MTLAAALFVVGLAVGWVGRDFWDFATEMVTLYREERNR